MKPFISAVVITLNEEKNLPNALGSVASWADEIVLVDMHSDDRTVEIARSFYARIFEYERVGFQDPARPFAMAQAQGEWIVTLDADEMIPHELSLYLQQVARENKTDVCAIPRLNYFSGGALLHSGWSPDADRQLRFFRKGFVEFSPKIHALPKPVPGGRVQNLNYKDGHYVVHFNFLDAAHYMGKLNRYTSIEATQAREHGERSGLRRFLWLPVREFLLRYFLRRGFRDGWRGFYYSAMMATYRLSIAAKLRELEEGVSGEACQEAYSRIAGKLLSEYPPYRS